MKFYFKQVAEKHNRPAVTVACHTILMEFFHLSTTRVTIKRCLYEQRSPHWFRSYPWAH